MTFKRPRYLPLSRPLSAEELWAAGFRPDKSWNVRTLWRFPAWRAAREELSNKALSGRNPEVWS